jgi:cyclase
MFKPKFRIIPKLEIKNNYLIKGVKFEGLRKIGDPVLYAKTYYKDSADQINIMDIVASLYSRENIYEIINKITNNIFIPINIGGGIKNIEDIKKLLNVGADRVIINSEALRNFSFLKKVKNIFGDQFFSISIEAKKINNKYYCMMDHGRENSGILVADWIKRLNKLIVGEIIVNSIDNDGMESGFDLDLLNIVSLYSKSSTLIISGGAANFSDFELIAEKYNIEGIAASTCFHFKRLSVLEIKKNLIKKKSFTNLRI